MRLAVTTMLLSAALCAAGFPVAAQSCKPQRAESDVAGIRLVDVKSGDRVLGDRSQLPEHQDKDVKGVDADFPYVRVLSQDGRQEVRFFTHYGASVGEYSEIEVRPVTAAGKDARRLPVDSLATERGVKLGMTEADLIRLLGPCHKTERRAGGVKRIAYAIDDEKHALLRRAGFPSYYAHYDFRAGRMIRFRIGFEYP